MQMWEKEKQVKGLAV